MTPSLSTRETAAKLYDTAWKAEDLMVKAEDEGVDDGRLGMLEQACIEAWRDYEDFVGAEGFELLTEASGLVIRCARTNWPLCDLDEVEEIESGELVLKASAYAA